MTLAVLTGLGSLGSEPQKYLLTSLESNPKGVARWGQELEGQRKEGCKLEEHPPCARQCAEAIYILIWCREL